MRVKKHPLKAVALAVRRHGKIKKLSEEHGKNKHLKGGNYTVMSWAESPKWVNFRNCKFGNSSQKSEG